MPIFNKATAAYDIQRGYTIELRSGLEYEITHRQHAPFRDLIICNAREYSVLSRDIDADSWATGETVSRRGLAGFLHVVRGVDDPKRLDRKDREGRETAWKADLKASSTATWAAKIAAHLSDGIPRTFNRIVLELSNHEYTADVALEQAPDFALWHLVASERVEHTFTLPVLFRAHREPEALSRCTSFFLV